MLLTNVVKNASVGVKLVAGFFTLVVFSVVIAFIAAGALKQYSEHARVAAEASRVESSLLDARTEEKNFQIRREDRYIKSASDLADDAASRAQDLSDALTLKANQKRVEAIVSGVSRYKALLNQYQSSIDDPDKVEAIGENLVKVARAAVDAATALQKSQLTSMGVEYDQAMTQIISTAVIVVLLAIILGWLLTRNITRPIRQTVEIANKVASGDLTVDASSDRGDEFGQLIAAFGAMITNLRALIKEIGQGANSIASSSEQLSAVADQTSAAVTGQRDKTDQVATAMNEMVATVSDVAKSAGAAFDAANKANEKAGQGSAAVTETLKYVSELKAQIDEVMGQLRGLQSETHNIGTILDVIKAVAEQTNLLALNAAIEAARAGEHGRGFAVVADEVRGLAGRTQTSAQEIESLINNLVASAETSNNNMERSTQLAGQTLESAEATRETIGAVVHSVDEINQYSSQIATASEQQAAVAEDINKNVTEIREESDQTASATNQVSSSSRELARLAEELNSQIARFHI